MDAVDKVKEEQSTYSNNERSAQEMKELDPTAEPVQAGGETLHRGLSSRQISMIAIGGAIGTGLIIGTGTGLARGGPLGCLLGYAIMGTVCYTVMCALGEMSALYADKKAFAGYASRFVHPALGFATGYNYLMKYLVLVPNQTTVTSIIIQYWEGGRAVPMEAWLIIIILVILLINFLGIRVFGEFEFWLSLIKVVTLIGLMICCVCLTAGGNPHGESIGFRYWKAPHGPFSHYLKEGNLGEFLGVWSVMTTALFAYMGTELIGVTVGECQNPRKNVPSAIKKTFWRILIFYVGLVFLLGLILSSDSEDLFIANSASSSAAASPFVVAIQHFDIDVLPGFLNACIMTFTFSAANSDLYIASRTLYALAAEGNAPKIFTRCNKMGVPYYSLLFTWLFSFLAYLRVTDSGAVVFGYFVSLTTIFGGLTWMSILYTHVRFVRAFKAQGISRDIVKYKAPFGWVGSYIAFVFTGIVVFFKGFDSFIPFNHATFITNYLGLPIFIIIFIVAKYVRKTHLVPLDEIDLLSGVKEIDDDEAYWKALKEEQPMNLWQRIWDKF